MTSVAAAVSTASGSDHAKHFRNLYGYVPTEWVCILFIALFGFSTLVHAVQAVRSRLWWLFPTACLAGVAEIIGWVARLISSNNISSINPYVIQITTTIVAPTPLIAANFVILGQVIRRIGQDYSRLSAKWYTIIFCGCDIISLIMQALGGAKASIAVKKGTNPQPGGHIMLAGVSFQLASLFVYVVLASEFLLRYAYDHPFKRTVKSPGMRHRSMDLKTKLMLFALGLEAIFLFIRSIYRVAELADGWGGVVITTQTYFNVFDGAMIVLAMYTLNFLHPAILLGNADKWGNKEVDYVQPSESVELDVKNRSL
ncbi:RTA1-domain-containing protein [Lentinus tigrinus ALCF2SS1-7]|uniref:RTA1-domain-containing protein n=1 Tax=Lentinus tigrinus ALCF2SS1-7 TaxID=1328758 RepID=UPI00116639C0|nr:RTA1-domain-containing protein [Lentinus tigrinus ALCF2SS1-7]